MYTLNTIVRVARLISNTLLGIGIGFILGVFFANGSLGTFIQSLI